MRRVYGSVPVFIVCALVAAGCGGSSSKNDAVSKCKDAAKSIANADARKAAESACDTVGNINTGAISTAVKSIQSSAKQACLAAAQNLPAGSARDQAVAGCNRIK